MNESVKPNGSEPDVPFRATGAGPKDAARGPAAQLGKYRSDQPAPTVEKAEAHVDAQLDKGIELSFPASDPVAASPMPDAPDLAHCRDPMEDRLDEAIALSFPASDPIAVSMYAELVTAAPTRPSPPGMNDK